jgi:hypothetical protein
MSGPHHWSLVLILTKEITMYKVPAASVRAGHDFKRINGATWYRRIGDSSTGHYRLDQRRVYGVRDMGNMTDVCKTSLVHVRYEADFVPDINTKDFDQNPCEEIELPDRCSMLIGCHEDFDAAFNFNGQHYLGVRKYVKRGGIWYLNMVTSDPDTIYSKAFKSRHSLELCLDRFVNAGFNLTIEMLIKHENFESIKDSWGLICSRLTHFPSKEEMKRLLQEAQAILEIR